jgi:hypothetical protein
VYKYNFFSLKYKLLFSQFLSILLLLDKGFFMKQLKLFLATFLLFTSFGFAKVITLSVTHPDPRYGIFSTYYLKVEPLNDKRNRVRLLEDLIFIDSKGKKWTAPKGHVVDGATIPKAFQSMIGTPYGGEYVLASVIHDVAYDEKKESWQEVHRAFYDAMLASGVEAQKASIMYIAVYEASQRWGKNKNEHLSQEKILNLFGIDKVAKKELVDMLGSLLKSLDIQK